MEIRFINKNLSKAAKKSSKIDIPKIKGTKTTSIKFCSNKNNKSRGRKKQKEIKSSNITTRLHENTLTNSSESLPKSLKYQGADISNAQDKSVLSIYTNELLSKYENENRPILTGKEKEILTQKAISSARIELREKSKQNGFYSASPDSINSSYRAVRENQNKAEVRNLKSDSTEPWYINLINEEASMRQTEKDLSYVNKVTFDASPQILKDSVQRLYLDMS